MAEDIYALCDALVDETAALSPVAATMLGIKGYDHLWDDFSTEGCEEQRRAARGPAGPGASGRGGRRPLGGPRR